MDSAESAKKREQAEQNSIANSEGLQKNTNRIVSAKTNGGAPAVNFAALMKKAKADKLNNKSHNFKESKNRVIR